MSFLSFRETETERNGHDPSTHREKRYREVINRAKNRTSALSLVGPRQNTFENTKKKKKASAYKKQKTSRGAFVSFDRVATRVAPSWPLFPLFTFFLGCSFASHPHRLPALVDPEVVVHQQAVGDAVLPCLLYTSPSPRDATLSRMPSSA